MTIFMNLHNTCNMLDEEIHEHLEEIHDKHEKEVAYLLWNMGLVFVAHNVVIPDLPKPNIGEIDLIFESDDTLILVEVSAGRNAVSDKQWTFFFKWSNDQAVRVLREKIGKQFHTITRVYFDLRLPPENMGGPEAVGVAKPGSGNMICYQDDLIRLRAMIKQGGLVKDNFVQALKGDPLISKYARRKLGIRVRFGLTGEDAND